MYWDTHMHCNFSGDSTALPEDMISASIEKQLDGICFTILIRQSIFRF